MTTVRTAHARPWVRPVLVAVVLLAAISAGCTTGSDEEPATVTLPEHGTTTSAPPSTPDAGEQGQTPPEEEQPPQLAWAVQIGGSGDDTFRAVTGSQDSVVAVGSSDAGVDTPSRGGTDVLSATVGSDGEVRGLEQFGSNGDDDATGVAASQESVLACGSTSGALGSTSGGSSDAWCAPLPRTNGEVAQLGGAETEQITGVALPDDADADNGSGAGSVTDGFASGTIDGYFPGAEDPAGRGLGAGDALAFKVAVDGSMLWARQFGTATADAATAVTAIGTDGLFVGFTDGDLEGPSKGGRDAWISLIDGSGMQRWITQFGATGNDRFDAVTSTGEARRGNLQIIGAGATDGDIDDAGPFVNSGGTDALVTSFAGDGSVQWATQLGSTLDDVATAVVADGSTVYVAGTTQSDPTSTDAGSLGELDPSVGPGGGGDGFLAALDATTGEVRWSIRLGSAGDETVTGLAVTEDGLLVMSGSTTGQVADTTPAGGLDAFLLAFPLPSVGGGAASSV